MLTSGILEPSNLHLPKPSDLAPSQVFLCALDMSFFPDFWQHRQKRAAESFNTGALTDRHFYTKKSLHCYTESFYARKLSRIEVFTQRSLYTEKLLHAEAFSRRSFYTEKPLHRGAFTHKGVYTQTLVHKEVFTQRALTHRRVYTQKLFHREVFTERAFTHGSFHTHKFFHREVFTQRSFYTQAHLHTEIFA